MPDTPARSVDATRPVADLSSSGVLWLINRVVFHPRGFALAIDPDNGTWGIIGDGSEPWRYDAESVDEDALFAAVQQTLAEAAIRERHG